MWTELTAILHQGTRGFNVPAGKSANVKRGTRITKNWGTLIALPPGTLEERQGDKANAGG